MGGDCGLRIVMTVPEPVDIATHKTSNGQPPGSPPREYQPLYERLDNSPNGRDGETRPVYDERLVCLRGR